MDHAVAGTWNEWDSAPSHKMVQKWFANFDCGYMSTNDAECPGPLKTVENTHRS